MPLGIEDRNFSFVVLSYTERIHSSWRLRVRLCVTILFFSYQAEWICHFHYPRYGVYRTFTPGSFLFQFYLGTIFEKLPFNLILSHSWEWDLLKSTGGVTSTNLERFPPFSQTQVYYSWLPHLSLVIHGLFSNSSNFNWISSRNMGGSQLRSPQCHFLIIRRNTSSMPLI